MNSFESAVFVNKDLGDTNLLLIEKEMGNETFSSIIISTDESCTDNYKVLVVVHPMMVGFCERDIIESVPNAKINTFTRKHEISNIQSILSEQVAQPSFFILTTYMWKLLKNNREDIDKQFDVLIEEVTRKDYYMVTAKSNLAKNILYRHRDRRVNPK